MDEKDQWAKIEELWVKYDKSATGILERDEALLFLKDILREYKGCEPTNDELENNFNIMDEDNSGDISKDEAQKYVKGYELGNSLKAILASA